MMDISSNCITLLCVAMIIFFSNSLIKTYDILTVIMLYFVKDCGNVNFWYSVHFGKLIQIQICFRLEVKFQNK